MASSISQAAVDGITCDRCLARPGHYCVTTTGSAPGTRLSYPHAVRTYALYDVWRSAFRDGMEQQASIIRQRLEGIAALTQQQVLTITRAGWK